MYKSYVLSTTQANSFEVTWYEISGKYLSLNYFWSISDMHIKYLLRGVNI